MQRFLVPLDGTPLAEKALPFAVERVRRLNGVLLLVRVVSTWRQLVGASLALPGLGPPPSAYGAPFAAIEEDRREAARYLQQLGLELRASGLHVTWEVRQGPIVSEIIDSAQEQLADVIVMVTRGYSGLRRLILGGVSDALIRTSGIPVLAIKAQTLGLVEHRLRDYA